MRRLVFLGTPAPAVPTLAEIAPTHEVVLAVTQPDRPKGRSSEPMPPPVKEKAGELGIPIAQPESGAELLEAISAAGPFDAGVVVAYGRILSPAVLDLPRRGFLNAHFSLLPRWRGAAPVERAMMAGDTMSGVTIIELDEGLDTGPVLTAQAIDIRPEENAGELTERLAQVGSRLITTVLDDYVSGGIEAIPQSDEGATYAAKITAADRPLDPRRPANELVNKVRALAPDPAATLDIDGDRHKVYVAAAHDARPETGKWEAVDGLPVVGTADAGLALLELQPPGKNRQRGEDWLRGRQRSRGVVG